MVNRGRSKGCTTCKQRRVKCDEAKPECRTCQRLSLCCGGYKTRAVNLKFVDQNNKFGNGVATGSPEALIRKLEIIPSPRPLQAPASEVDFYLGHYVNIGRRRESTRGFFEVLMPIYSAQKQESALSLAVLAVASEIANLWRYGPASLASPSESSLQAVVALRRSIQDPVEQRKPATALAILALQWYENVAAVYGHRSANPTHHAGALSLLPFMISDDDSGNQTAIASIRRFISHAEISSAMRQKRPVNEVILSWMSGESLSNGPQNPSALLDAIGAKVADLQARYVQRPLDLSDNLLRAFAIEAKAIDQQLQTWSCILPEHWKPQERVSGEDFDASIPAYRSTCESYPTLQIANIWNLWRVQRLVLFKIMFESMHPQTQKATRAEYQRNFQELVDAICYSVPFYLGNRMLSMHFTDFEDSSILLCGQSIPSQASPGQSPQSPAITTPSVDEHRRQVIASGPWHLMSPLSRLLTLFAEDHGQHLTGVLRSGQHKWIRQQFLRVTILLQLSAPDQYSARDVTDLDSQNTLTKADDLASLVRKGAMFMSGP